MGWASAIQAAKRENRIKELEDELQTYRDKYGFIGTDSASGYSGIETRPEGYAEHPEHFEWTGPGTSGYRYIGMDYAKDKD